MIEIEEIKKNYTRFSDEKLISLTNDLETLRLEIIPVLQEELIKRKLPQSEKITEFLNKGEYTFDVKDFIQKEIKNGETIENIEFKLKNMNIDMLEYINSKEYKEQNIRETEISEFLSKKNIENLSEKELEKKLDEKFQITPEEKKVIETNLHFKKSNISRKITISILLGILLIFMSFVGGQIRLGLLFSLATVVYTSIKWFSRKR